MKDTIIESFDTWTEAQGLKYKGRVKSIDNISLEGIARLRELILELAIRGKLVPQNPADEPASELLKKVAKENINKISINKILIEDFELPNNWEWTLLGAVFEITSSKRIHVSDYTPIGIPFFRSKEIGELQKAQPITTDIFISAEKYNELTSLAGFPKEGDLMLTSVGSIGNSWICDDRKFYYKDGNITKISLNKYIVMRYVQIFIASPLFTDQVLDKVSGTAYNALTIVKLKNLRFPLPPLAGQHRIVAKVDELMALCDQLEAEQTANLKTHQQLVKTLLQTLTEAEDAEALQAAWQRISAHFDTLFCTEDSIDQLKQTILQLAIMGKLVPQNPADEPASELLKKIAKEKAKLIKEGKLKKEKPLPEITDEEKPFELPEGWEFVRLLSLCELITKGSSPKWQGISYVEDENGVLFITSENVGSYKLLLDNRKYVESKFNELEPRSILKSGDFLMNIVGGSIGRTAIYDLSEIANINQAVCLIRALTQYIDPRYLLYFFNSEICISYMFDKQVDNARANLSMGNIAKFVFPLPPLSEQKKIVNKVDELMALCDKLSDSILKAQEIKVSLSKTIVENAVA